MSIRLHDTLCTDAEEQRLGVPVTPETWERMTRAHGATAVWPDGRPRPSGEPPVLIRALPAAPERSPYGRWWAFAGWTLFALLALGVLWVAGGLRDWGGALEGWAYCAEHLRTRRLPQ